MAKYLFPGLLIVGAFASTSALGADECFPAPKSLACPKGYALRQEVPNVKIESYCCSIAASTPKKRKVSRRCPEGQVADEKGYCWYPEGTAPKSKGGGFIQMIPTCAPGWTYSKSENNCVPQ
jgi:hypothetical protein